MKRLFLPLFIGLATLIGGQALAQNSYTIQFRSNTNGNIGNNGNTFLLGDDGNNRTSFGATNQNTALWNFVPVPGEQGWYFIQWNNRPSYYLRATLAGTGQNSLLELIYAAPDAIVSDNRHKFRIVKYSTGTANDATPTISTFKLIAKGTTDTGTTPALIGAARTTGGGAYTYATVTSQNGNNFNATNTVINLTPATNTVISNSDQELTSNYDPVNSGTTTWTGVTTITDDFPVFYTQNGAALQYGNDAEDNEYYYTRLSLGDVLTKTPTTTVTSSNSQYTLGFYARADLAGVSLTIQVGTYSVTAPVIATASSLADNTGWTYYTADFSAGNNISTTTNITFTNSNNCSIDVDNIIIVARPWLTTTFIATQNVHQLTRIYYVNPGTQYTFTSVTQGPSYFRWYNPNSTYEGVNNPTTPMLITGFPATQPGAAFGDVWNETTGRAYRTDNGLFAFSARTTDDVGNANGQSAYFIPPVDELLTNGTLGHGYTISCDASYYQDFATTLAGNNRIIAAPTLSYHNHFDLRGSWQIAKLINDALAGGGVLENYDIEAPANTATSRNSATRIRLTPQYAPNNYWFTTTTGTLTDAQAKAATLTSGTRFYWYQSDATFSDQTAIVGSTNIESGKYNYRNNASNNDNGGYEYLEINTNGLANSTEYYRVFVSDGTNQKEIARYTINYKPQSSVGPVWGNTDLLDAKDKNKLLLIANRDFDDIGNTYFGLSKNPVGIDETSYGFVNPEKFATEDGGNTLNPGDVFLTQGYHAAQNVVGYWSEYSILSAFVPSATTAAQGTGSILAAQGNGTSYSATGQTKQNSAVSSWAIGSTTNYPAIYDITHRDNPNNYGNFMYIDAAQAPGLFARLEISEDLCVGANLIFTANIVNVNISSAGNTDNNRREIGTTRPNLVFILKDKTTGQEAKRFMTGDIGRTTNAGGSGAGVWNQVCFEFALPAGVNSSNLVLEIYNNGLGTLGNDFGLDAIKIYRSNPPVVVVRNVAKFCRPDEGQPTEALPLKVEIDLDDVGTVTDGYFYYRFEDFNNAVFPAGSYNMTGYKADGSTVIPNVFKDIAIPASGTDDAYDCGAVYLCSNPVASDYTTDTDAKTDHVIAYGSDGQPIAWIEHHNVVENGVTESHCFLVFYQQVPASVIDASGVTTGDQRYKIRVAENAYPNLVWDHCNGVGFFPVVYDETILTASAAGTSGKINPYELDICTNSHATAYADTRDLNSGEYYYTYYDWYIGPKNNIDVGTLDSEDYQALQYDPDYNTVGFNTYPDKQVRSLTDAGLVSNLKLDLTMFRRYYLGTIEPTVILPTSLTYNASINNTYSYSLLDASSNTVNYSITISDQDDLDALLERINTYISDGALVLDQRSVDVFAKTKAKYYVTVIPIEKGVHYKYTGTAPPSQSDQLPVQDQDGWHYDIDANGNKIPLYTAGAPICPTPTETYILPDKWGPEVVFGEVKDDGTPKMDYPSDEEDYIYTVRISEKYATQFVAPMLYLDEVRNANIYLDSLVTNTDVKYAVPAANKTVKGAHIGVIDTTDAGKGNRLDRNQTVKADYIDKGQLYVGGTFDMNTCWNLDSIGMVDAVQGFKYYLEAYPIIVLSQGNGGNNYYLDGDAAPGHPLIDEGNPLPIGTVINGEPLDNNKIALEITADSLRNDIQNHLLEYESGKYKFKAGYAYYFSMEIRGESRNELLDDHYCEDMIPFRLLVVPDTVLWTSNTVTTTMSSWNNDANWKYQAYHRGGQLSEQDGPRSSTKTNAFVPLQETHVILPDADTLSFATYPMLTDPTTFGTYANGVVTNVEPTKYIEYDYNFVPNAATEVHFKPNSELGRPFDLQYDSVKIDLRLETGRWYGLTAPLHNMYSGDFEFPYSNPAVRMRLHNTKNPDTQKQYASWTTSFSKTEIETARSMGFALHVPRNRFADAVLYDDTGVKSPYTIESRDSAVYYFPVKDTIYRIFEQYDNHFLYNSDQVAKTYAGRFIFEDTTIVDYKNPRNNPAVLPVALRNEDASVETMVVGNHLMSHLDFNKFAAANTNSISGDFKLLESVDNGKAFRYVSYARVDSETVAGVLITVSTSDRLDAAYQIAPMQSFIVTLTSAAKAADPVTFNFGKEMSITNHNPLARLRAPSREPVIPDVLRIRAEREGLATNAVVVLRGHAHDGFVAGEDTKLMLIEGNTNIPKVYTIADEMWLDINQLQAVPASLPIGIHDSGRGETTITITGLNSLSGSYDLSFLDTKMNVKLPVDDGFAYTFDNTEGNQEGRFFIVCNETGIDSAPAASLAVYGFNSRVTIISTDGSPIRNAAVYSIDGRLIRQVANTGATHIEIPVETVQAVIVKTNSETSSKVTKVIVK
jgi:hypothetical protein